MKARPPVIEVISDEMADVLRRLGPQGRLRALDSMFVAARELIETSVRQMHPDWNDDQVKNEIARRIAGDCD